MMKGYFGYSSKWDNKNLPILRYIVVTEPIETQTIDPAAHCDHKEIERNNRAADNVDVNAPNIYVRRPWG